MPDAITLPAVPHLVGSVRSWVATALANTPRVDDAVLVASEYATNALRHSASRDGGNIQLVVEHRTGWARIELHDAGPAATEFVVPDGESDEYGRGLLLVDAVADKWGHDRTEAGAVRWAEFTWPTQSEE